MTHHHVMNEALQLYDLGYDIIPVGVKREGVFRLKDPGIVPGWQTVSWSRYSLQRMLDKDDRRGVGLRLGNGIIDIEADTKAADEYANTLMGWSSSFVWKGAGADGHYPGTHRVFRLTPEQQKLWASLGVNNKTEWPGGVEVRLTGQSVLPPAGGREWINRPTAGPERLATLPDDVFTTLTSGLTISLSTAPQREADPDNAGSPGEDFCERGDWSEILTPHGWQVDGEHVTRPGKSDGVSGTLGRCQSDTRGDLLYIFSTSPDIAPLEAGVSYSKFEAYAALEHGGDFSAAARELRRQGYGQEVDVVSLFDTFDEDDTPEYVPAPRTEIPDPELDDDVFKGSVIGQYCLALRDYTWVDMAAVYLQALEIFGALIGRHAYYTYGGNARPLSDYLLLAGDTGSGKGLSYDMAKGLFLGGGNEHFSPVADAFRFVNMGRFGSGEGLMTALDARKDAGHQIDGLQVGEYYRSCVLATDQEGVGAFRKMMIDGSTLGDTLLKAWDSNSLSNTTASRTLFVRNPQVSLIWHVTPDVLDDLPATALDGGLINRLKLVLCKKAERLTRQKTPPEDLLAPFRDAIRKSVEWFQEHTPGEIEFSPEADDLLWSIQQWQHKLSGGTARTHERFTAHVERQACRLAILEQREMALPEDVQLAWKLQDYVFRCTEKLLGLMRATATSRSRSVEDVAETLHEVGLEKWGADGATLTQIRMEVFRNNVDRGTLHTALERLGSLGRVTREKVKGSRGRAATRVRFYPSQEGSVLGQGAAPNRADLHLPN